jgi:hypothetical protein
MQYKVRYRPLERLSRDGWQRLTEQTASSLPLQAAPCSADALRQGAARMAARICSAPLPIRAGLSEAQHRALVWALHGAALVLGAGLAAPAAAQQAAPAHPFSRHRPNLQAPSPRPQPRPSPTRPVDIVAGSRGRAAPGGGCGFARSDPRCRDQEPRGLGEGRASRPADALPAAPQAAARRPKARPMR